MPSPLFYLFAAIMVAGGLMVVLMRNPVSSALSMVLSFIGLAGLFIGLNSYFVGILQILVYAGAIMVLFIFIIMLLDVKKEEKDNWKGRSLAVGIAIPAVLLIQLAGVLSTMENSRQVPELDFKQALAATNVDGEPLYKEGTMIHQRLESKRLPDTHLIGQKLFTDYNFPLQVIAVLLLVATVGCVTLSKKSAPIPNALGATEPPAEANTEAQAPAEPEKKQLPIKKPPTAKNMLEREKQPAEVKNPVEPEKLAEAEQPAEVAKPVEEEQAVETKQAAKEEPSNTSIDEKKGLVYTSRPDEIDDLKVISGVGPVLEKKLHGFGIYTYEQISNWTEEHVSEFDNLLSFKGRITRDNWLTQAADLHAKKNA